MSWEDFYLTCFLVGLVLSLVSLLGGAARFRAHFPGHVGHGAHGLRAGRGGHPALNFSTATVFLAWFGGAGYLLTRFSSVLAVLAVLFALATGLAGATVVYLFLFKYLLAQEHDEDPADYDMVGVLGRVSSSIFENGTGEMIFSQGGARRSACVRSDDQKPIGKGAEVVVIRYERGVAYVRPWDEMNSIGKEN